MKSTGIIAFCGSKSAGKSTSYEMFKEFYNGEMEELAFAGHLKTTCSDVFDIEMKYFLEPDLKEVELEAFINLKGDHVEQILKQFNVDNYTFDDHVRPHIGQVFETPRQLLQYVGTEVLHPIDPLIHAKILLQKRDPNKLTVVTDLRFEAEFHFMKETLGEEFTPVYIKNSRAELMAQSDPHPSERQMTLFKDKCFIIPNEDTKEDLKNKLSSFVDGLFKGS